jgi:hypothetical protein
LAVFTGKGMAGTAWRMLVDDAFAAAVLEGFELDKREKNGEE